MGTNYYHRSNICSCCGRYDETHICKSLTIFEAVCEWPDDPAATEEVVTVGSWAQWKERLRADGEVWDEYGELHPIEKFIRKVEDTDAASRRRQYDYFIGPDRPVWMDYVLDVSPRGEWLDADGFSFSGRAFE